MNRRAFLRSCLCEAQAAVSEVEGSQAQAARELDAARFPPQSACDHQVDDEVEVILEPEDDALPQAFDGQDSFARDLAHRRIVGPDNEGTGDSGLFDHTVDDVST
jgi:hypothetical protein